MDLREALTYALSEWRRFCLSGGYPKPMGYKIESIEGRVRREGGFLPPVARGKIRHTDDDVGYQVEIVVGEIYQINPTIAEVGRTHFVTHTRCTGRQKAAAVGIPPRTYWRRVNDFKEHIVLRLE